LGDQIFGPEAWKKERVPLGTFEHQKHKKNNSPGERESLDKRKVSGDRKNLLRERVGERVSNLKERNPLCYGREFTKGEETPLNCGARYEGGGDYQGPGLIGKGNGGRKSRTSRRKGMGEKY